MPFAIIMPFAATCMDLEIMILNKLTKTEKDKNCVNFLICGIYFKMIQLYLFTKQKETHRLREQTLVT